jgi:energy-converting hydrogenase A subunit M
MTGRCLYEKDLRPMKYTILTSTKHDETVREIARYLGVPDAKLRRVLIRRLDMSLLENLQVRWEMGLRHHADGSDPVAAELGRELFTRFIPLVDPGTMESIANETKAMIKDGSPAEEALSRGKARIREAILT